MALTQHRFVDLRNPPLGRVVRRSSPNNSRRSMDQKRYCVLDRARLRTRPDPAQPIPIRYRSDQPFCAITPFWTRPGRAALPALCRERQRSIRPEREARVVGDFPHVTVGISEVSREATPISSLTRLEDGPTSPFGLAENPLHLRLAVDIDGQAHFPEPRPVTSRKPGVGGKQISPVS